MHWGWHRPSLLLLRLFLTGCKQFVESGRDVGACVVLVAAEMCIRVDGTLTTYSSSCSKFVVVLG